MVHSHVPAHSVGAVVSTGMSSVGMPSAVVSTGMPSAVLSAHLGEEVAHAARPDTDKHLNEVGTANGVKRALGLSGRRLGK